MTTKLLRSKRENYWYSESQSREIVGPDSDGKSYMPRVNRDGQFLTRDQEIIERYRVMFEHFQEHPELLKGENWEMLETIWNSDKVLAQDELLKKQIGRLLGGCYVANSRRQAQ